MKLNRGSTLFLQGVILLIAVGVLASLIRFPQTEGRAANLDLLRIYADPFIIYMYIASIPFFVGLYQVFKLVNFVEANQAFSQAAVKAVGNIKYCALAMIGFLVVAILYIRVVAQGDDPAGPTMIGLIAIVTSGAIATAAAVFQKRSRQFVKP